MCKEESLQLLNIAVAREKQSSKMTSRNDFLKEIGIDERELSELPKIEMECDVYAKH